MAQHDYNIANAGGATVRADINNVLAAVQSLNSGSSAPSSTVAGMLWLDTSGGLPYALKIRDGGNNHWITLTSITDPGADSNAFLPAQINLPTSGGVFESDGSTEILTESSGTVSLKNATIDGTVSMASSGMTVRNIEQVALASDQSLNNSNTLTTFFSPTYDPKFSGSKVMGSLTIMMLAERNSGADGRKILEVEFSGNDITDITFGFGGGSQENIGGYDFGNSGIIVYYTTTINMGLLTTSGTGTITASVKLKNMNSSSDSLWAVRGNNTLAETHFTWIEYK